MEDQDKLAPQPAAQRRERKPRRAGLFIVLAAVGAAVAGGLVTNAFGNDMGRWWGGGGRHGWGMHMGMGPGMDDPAAMGQHMVRMIRHLAVDVDATPEQEGKLAAIAKSAADDLMPLHQQARDARKQAVALLAAPTIDRAAIEQFRTQQLQLADSATKRLTQALADAAEVLTPEQRQQVVERLSHMGGRHGPRHAHGDRPGPGQPGDPDAPDQPE